MTKENQTNFLDQRVDCILYYAEPALSNEHLHRSGWIGGNAPEFFDDHDEEGSSDTLLQEDCNYPFGFGSLYVYAKMGTTEVGHPVAGFWQFS
ncbi:hypothetical protein [Paenibacillus sp. TH7-28]